MKTYLLTDEAGLPVAFYNEDVHGPRMLQAFVDVEQFEDVPVFGDAPEPTEDDPDPKRPVIGTERQSIGFEKQPAGFVPNPDCLIPAAAVLIGHDQWQEMIENQGRRKYVDGQVVAYDPPPLPPLVPSSASKLGLIRALREAGAWHDVKARIAADDTMQEDWDAATDIRRADPLMQSMIAGLRFDDARVDALLIRANELVS